jgi:hypothetical protein
MTKRNANGTFKAATYKMLRATKAGRPSKQSEVCAFVWDFLDEFEGTRKQAVHALTTKHGVNYWTARTQYQLWTGWTAPVEMAEAA